MPSRIFRVVDLEEEKLSQRRRRLFLITVTVSIMLLAYKPIKHYSSRWRALSAVTKLASYIHRMKTNAIHTQKPMELRVASEEAFELYEVTTCGLNPKAKRLETVPLANFGAGIRLTRNDEYQDALASGDEVAVLGRFCYDPLNGSSLSIDGLMRGSIYISALAEDGTVSVARLTIEGMDGQISIE